LKYVQLSGKMFSYIRNGCSVVNGTSVQLSRNLQLAFSNIFF